MFVKVQEYVAPAANTDTVLGINERKSMILQYVNISSSSSSSILVEAINK